MEPTTEDALRALGANVRAWRKILGVTAELLAQRANVSRATVRRIEHGEGGVRADLLMSVLGAIGQEKAVIKATDPLNTDIGRARAGRLGAERVRSKTW